MSKKKNNPNGANQYLADPRQSLFLSYYLDPKSTTFSNALQSALRAGYEQEYAESITAKMPDWLAEGVGKLSMLKKAERNLEKMLDLDEEDVGRLKVKADITKFVAERIGKNMYGKDEQPKGDTYNTINVFNAEQSQRIARRVLARSQSSEERPD